MASYPGAVKSFTSKNAGDVIQPVDINDVQDEINAIEAGILNGTANLNTSNSTLVNLSVLHNSTLGSTITIGTVPMIWPASGGSTGQVLTISSTSGSTLTLAWQAVTANPAVTLLKANSGTDTGAGNTNVDTVAISGLTAKDTLLVKAYGLSSSQATANFQLYHNTDGVQLYNMVNPITANNSWAATADIGQSQASSTSIYTNASGALTGGSVSGATIVASVATAWTGSWTLALRHSGVTAGGTLQWKWSVYRISGQ